MVRKTTAILVFTLAALLSLVACQRSASQAPVTEPTRTSLPLVQTATGMVQAEFIGTTQMIQTMTALANQGTQLTPIAPQVTPTVGTGFETTPGAFTLVPPTGAPGTPAPVTTPLVVVATATPGRPASYTLMQGEFPYCIARRFNVNQSELLTLNGLSSSAASKGYLSPCPANQTFCSARVFFSVSNVAVVFRMASL